MNLRETRKRVLRKCMAGFIAGGMMAGISVISVHAAAAESQMTYEGIVAQVGDDTMKQIGENIRNGKDTQVAVPVPEATEGTVYYISPSGNDSNAGTSPDTAWKSIEKVNATTFQPGDMILFEADSQWELTVPLHPLGSGKEGSPIVIGAYGEGAKPQLSAKKVEEDSNRHWMYGETDKYASDGIYLEDQEYMEIRDLEISNLPDGYTAGDDAEQQALRNDRRGIHIVGTLTEKKKILKGIYLHDLYVHHVIGDAMSATKWDSSKRSGGIVFETILKDEESGLPIIKDTLGYDTDLAGLEPAYFEDVLIEKNVLIDNGFSSIAIKQVKKWGFRPNNDGSKAPQYYYTEEQGWYPHRNICIQNNYLDHEQYKLGANTIYLTGSKDSIIQHNYSVGAGTSGIELNQTDNIVVQYNEVYKSMKKATGADSNGIDPDRSSTNALIQYNYVHDCGDGILLCGFNYGSAVVRYNVIQDSNSEKRYINVHGSKGHNYIYNNIFYNSTDEPATFIATSGGENYLNDRDNHHYIYNNIFYSPNAVARLDDGSALEYSNNSYLGVNMVPEEDGSPILGNPDFENVDSLAGGTGQAVELTGFRLKTTSPMINGGKEIETDTLGNLPNTVMPAEGINGALTDLGGVEVPVKGALDNGVYEFHVDDKTKGGLNGYTFDAYKKIQTGVDVKVVVGQKEYHTTSDSYGFYSIYGLPAGEAAQISASAENFEISEVVSLDIPAGDISFFNMVLGESTSTSGTVSGKIENVDDVTVSIADSTGKEIASVVTGKERKYVLEKVPVGEGYTVIFAKEGYISTSIENVTVKAGYETVLEEVRLKSEPGNLKLLFKENFTYDTGTFSGNDIWNVEANGGTAEILEDSNGNRALKIAKTDGAGSVKVWNKLPIGAAGQFTIDARIMRTQSNGSNASEFAVYTGETIGTDGIISDSMANFGFYNPNYYIFVHDLDTYQVNPRKPIRYSCKANTWYDVRIDVDMDTDTFDFYIDGTKVEKGLKLRTSGEAMNFLSVWANENRIGDLLLDYIWIYEGKVDTTTAGIKEIHVSELGETSFNYDAGAQTFIADKMIPYNQESVKIKVDLENPFGSVSINGTNLGYADDGEYVEVPVTSGVNTIPVQVRAAGEEGVAETMEYFIQLERQDSSLLAYLTQLNLSDIELNPEFTGREPEYDEMVYDGGITNKSEHTLTYETVIEGCNAQIALNGVPISSGSSGTVPIELNPGENTIELRLISQSEDEFQNYVIKVFCQLQ